MVMIGRGYITSFRVPSEDSLSFMQSKPLNMYALVKALNPVLSLANVDDMIKAKLKVTSR